MAFLADTEQTWEFRAGLNSGMASLADTGQVMISGTASLADMGQAEISGTAYLANTGQAEGLRRMLPHWEEL